MKAAMFFAHRFSVLAFLSFLLASSLLGQKSQSDHRPDEHFKRYDINRLPVSGGMRSDSDTRSFDVRAAGRDYLLIVEPHEIKAPFYRAEDTGPAGVTDIDAGAITTFRGYIPGLKNSEVRLTIDGPIVEGFFDAGGTRFFVEPARRYFPAANLRDLIVYTADDLLHREDFWCGSDVPSKIEYGREMVTNGQTEAVQALRRLDLATEADFEYVSMLGGSAQANNEILGILNMAEGTYSSELNLTIRVVFQHTWSTPDPFAAPNNDQLLRNFQNYWNTNYGTVSRNAAHLFSGKSIALSQGFAFLGVVCSNPTFAYGLSGYISWAPGKFLITAHEIGHNLGANHADAAQSCSNTLMNTQLSGATPMTFCSYSRNEIGSYVMGSGSCLGTVSNPPFDFDGDGRSDIGVFRPSNGVWYLNRSTAGFTAFQFGQNGDRAVTSDFDGDRKADPAIYRNGVWWRYLSATGSVDAINFGLPGDVPAPADFDGDGKADLAVYRPSTGIWYWLNSSDGAFSAVQFGLLGDIPMAADYDGDGRADINLFRPSNGVWYRINSSTGSFSTTQFGITEDIPVIGDFDGDRRIDIAVWRPSTGVWYWLRSSNGQFVVSSFGMNGDIPSPADFDGDGRTDVAVFRPSTGVWHRLSSSNGAYAAVQFGLNGDAPVQSYYVR
jgi:hypothetical protein